MLSIASLLLALAPQAQRPHDPFVFRSVLDGRPRMVTLALADELWAAYDATTCGLHKAWEGGVRFSGPVFDAVHGPQPTSEGVSWTVGEEGPVWHAFGPQGEIPLEARWRGYRLEQGEAVLLYELAFADGRGCRVEERPSFLRPEDRFDEATREEAGFVAGDVGFLRVWHALGLPDDVKLALSLTSGGARARNSNGLEHERFVDERLPDGSVRTQIHSQLVLSAQRPHNHLLMFFEPHAEPPRAPGPVRAQGALRASEAGSTQARGERAGAEGGAR